MKIGHLRWYVAALLFLSTVINYIDRQTLSVVAPVLTKELNISQVEYSQILQAFLIAYTIMYVVSGVLVDRWGTKVSLAVFVAAWSATNALHMFARNAFQLAIFRFLLGIAEPGNYNAASRVASEWYPAKERAFINGLVNAGSAVGAVVAVPLVTWTTVWYGWRFAFVATGALGFVWLAFWLLFYELPQRHRSITARELAHIQAGAESAEAGPLTRWGALWTQREVWGLLLARFFGDPVWWFYLFWMPKYLVEQRGFGMTEMALVAWMPYLSSDVGALLGGYLSGRLIGAKRTPLQSRYMVMLGSAFLMPISIAIPFSNSSGLVVALLCVITFLHMIWKTNLMTITNDIYPVAAVGSVSGLVSLGSGIGGVLFMNLTGHMVESFSYSSMFLIMGFLHPVAFVVCRMLVGKSPAIARPATPDNRNVRVADTLPHAGAR
ncbi:MAG: MFS transporter [Acidobacteria bacterium]|nr:MFS transporter [Acidobacteriota bacterium]MBI3279088.1 MFS transporter [Acidobacteriota bacterium]